MRCQDIRSLDPKALYNIIYYRVLLNNPEIVVILHPFFGADMYLRLHIAHLIQKLKERGITILLLAMHMTDTLAVSDQLLVIENGRLTKENCEIKSELINENYYGNDFTARLQKE